MRRGIGTGFGEFTRAGAAAGAQPREVACRSRLAWTVVFGRAAAAASALLLCQCTSLEYGAEPELLSHGRFDLYVYRPQVTASTLN